MGTTFFRNLTTLDAAILQYKGKGTYLETTRTTLTRLIRTVEQNEFISERNAISKFVCRTYRSSLQEQVDLWNSSHEKKTTLSGIKSAKSRTSDHLYKLFGDNFLTVFLGEDTEGLEIIDTTITALTNKDYLFDFLLVKGVSDLIPLGSQQDYELSECTAELELLSLLSASNISALLTQVNLDKLAYLKMIGTQPLMDYYKVNMDKAMFLKALNKYGTTDSRKLCAAPTETNEEYEGLSIHKDLLPIITSHVANADLMGDCDPTKVQKVRAILNNFYTVDGLGNWLDKNVDPLELNNALTLV